jgi:hypothetical protein
MKEIVQKMGQSGLALFFFAAGILMIEFPAEFLYMFCVCSRGEGGGDTLRWMFHHFCISFRLVGLIDQCDISTHPDALIRVRFQGNRPGKSI